MTFRSQVVPQEVNYLFFERKNFRIFHFWNWDFSKK